MTTTQTRLLPGAVVLAAALVFSSATQAQITIYDNASPPSSYTGKFHSPGSGIEFGDEVTLTVGTTAQRVINAISFEYFGASLSGDETGQLFLRTNDGPGGAPGAAFFTSPTFSLANDFNVLTVGGFEASVPGNASRITWTVQFSGVDLNAGERAGLVFYNPPSVGSSFDDFWQNTGGVWSTLLLDGGATPANFAAKISAVPEPSTFVLAALAGLGYLGLRRRRS